MCVCISSALGPSKLDTAALVSVEEEVYANVAAYLCEQGCAKVKSHAASMYTQMLSINLGSAVIPAVMPCMSACVCGGGECNSTEHHQLQHSVPLPSCMPMASQVARQFLSESSRCLCCR